MEFVLIARRDDGEYNGTSFIEISEVSDTGQYFYVKRYYVTEYTQNSS